MMARFKTYGVLLLVAMVLTLLPAAMWADMAIPMKNNWENWYWKGQPHPRPTFSLQDPPFLFRAEVAAYKTLVAPPAWARRAFTGWPTAYASFFMQPYRETAGRPPLAETLEHSAWALPVWFFLLVAVRESLGLARRLRRKVG
jgi:hypothetical protein